MQALLSIFRIFSKHILKWLVSLKMYPPLFSTKKKLPYIKYHDIYSSQDTKLNLYKVQLKYN